MDFCRNGQRENRVYLDVLLIHLRGGSDAAMKLRISDTYSEYLCDVDATEQSQVPIDPKELFLYFYDKIDYFGFRPVLVYRHLLVDVLFFEKLRNQFCPPTLKEKGYRVYGITIEGQDFDFKEVQSWVDARK